MNTLTTDQLRHEVKNPGSWESLFHLSAELLRRLDIAEAQLVAWRRTCDSDTDDAHDRREHAKERSRDYPEGR